jgi:hypothetical protein
MLSLKTTIGLIAALSVVATTSVASALTPQAFGQFDATVDQDQTQTATQTANNNVLSDIDQDIDQEQCQQGAAATSGGVADASQNAFGDIDNC